MTLSVPLYVLKRRAKAHARQRGLPLHAALDHVAREQGFSQWSHLASTASSQRTATTLLRALRTGHCALLAGRPGHGKTLLGLELLTEAVRLGRPAWFFSLESTTADVASRLRQLGADPGALGSRLHVDCSDAVSAPHIAEQLAQAPPGAVVVVDYLQILDQQRARPALAEQVATLADTARARDALIVVLSQIDRHFDLENDDMPGMQHLRLPNPLDIGHFSNACFIHAGKITLEAVRVSPAPG